VRGEEGSREDKEGMETDVLGEEQGMVAAGLGVRSGVGLRGGETSRYTLHLSRSAFSFVHLRLILDLVLFGCIVMHRGA